MRRLGSLVLAVAVLAETGVPCTGFYSFQRGLALAGNNEDFWNPDTKVRFVPAEGERLGRVYFGFGNLYPQGGMNTAGLFFDGFATERLPLATMDGRPAFEGNLIDEAMATCSSVAEVKALLARYDLSFLESAMLLFGDRHGDSIIVEGDVVLDKVGRDQVLTNFHPSRTPEADRTCPRFLTARRMLLETGTISVERFAEILARVGVRQKVATQYSNVYDLTNGVVHLYHFLDFDHPVTFDLAEELEKGPRVLDLPSLFPAKPEFERFVAERRAEIEEIRAARTAQDVDRSAFGELAGTYAVPIGARSVEFEVSVAGGDVFLGFAGKGDDERAPFLPEGGDRFFHAGFDGTTVLHFRRNETGAVTGVDYVDFRGQVHPGTRVVREAEDAPGG